MTRLAKTHPVYFVEEPILDEQIPSASLTLSRQSGVTIVTPVLPAASCEAGGFNRSSNTLLRALLARFFKGELRSPDVVAWYYTPMALGALPGSLNVKATVFDAMDELANFRGAPKELRSREHTLMQEADLLFSGGPSLHDARKYRHPRAFCFPSGVDEAHFRHPGGPPPADIASLSSPVVGFYGVLDERIDFDLIVGIADARPDWSIAMIGPVVKVGEDELARRPNIHYLGMRSYEELPRYLSKFDAAILPFALNEATRFISPTKTLEYLAGGKPVVSTPIRDVIDLYEDVVEIASTPAGFVEAIETLWSGSTVPRSFRQHLVRKVLARHDWDVIALRMQHLLHDVLAGRSTFDSLTRDVHVRETPNYSSTSSATAD